MQHWGDIPCGLPLRLLVCLGDGPEGLEKGVKFVFINDALVLKTGIILIKKRHSAPKAGMQLLFAGRAGCHKSQRPYFSLIKELDKGPIIKEAGL